MIETFPPRLLQGPSRDSPLVLADTRVSLECGCEVMLGLRLDSHESATAARSCSERHNPIISRFTEKMRERPQELALAEGVQWALNEANR